MKQEQNVREAISQMRGLHSIWLDASRFALFFDDFDAWLSANGRDGCAEASAHSGVGCEDATDLDGLHLEYDNLFKGTHADVYIPLWTSVCKTPNGSLLDETTLEVIRTYNRLGYVPADMDGNPPDYIGQGFAFVAYLSACACYACRQGDSDEQQRYEREIQSFMREFLLDTIRVVAAGIREHATDSAFLSMADELTRFATRLGTEGADANASTLDSDDGLCGIFAAGDKLCAHAAGDIFETATRRDVLYSWNAYESGPNLPIADGDKRTIKTAGRNNCGGKCSIDATVQDGCLLNVETGCTIGDPVVLACVRGRGYRKTYLDGRRLRYPMIRAGERGEGRFRRISWEEAADVIAAEWMRIRDTYGPGSRYVNYGIGVNAAIRPDYLVRRLLNLDGGYLNFHGSYSFACSKYTLPYIYGDEFCDHSVEDLKNTKLLILWAHNPAVTLFGAQRNHFIAGLKEAGVRIVVIDPRKSDTAMAVADEWIPIRPSTDGALADAMAYVIRSENLHDQRFIDTYCVGFDEEHMPQGAPAGGSYFSYLFGEQDGIEKTPEWAAEITGISANKIRELAREYATTKPACLLPGLGNQRIANGEQTVRGMTALACLTGNVGIPGGGAGGAGFSREEKIPQFPQGTNPYPGVISCFQWTQAIEEGISMTRERDRIQGMEKLDADIKMMFSLASNTLVNQHGNINDSIRIVSDASKCEFIVCSDVFMTPSARFADLLLPAPSLFEDENIPGPWATGHYLLSNNKVVEPMFGCRTEYDWLSDVAKHLGLWEAWSDGRTSLSEWLEHIYEELRQDVAELPPYAEFKALGGHTYKNPKTYIAYEDQIRDPENHPFSTPSGKIEIYSKQLADLNLAGIPAIPRYTPCPEGFEDPIRERHPLQLIGWHSKRRTHSIHDNNPWMEELEPQCLWMNAADAKVRSLHDGDTALVYNDRGQVQVPVRITERVMPGVAAMPQGAWYTPDGKGIDTRGSINVLTSSRPTPLAKGTGQHTARVEVQAATRIDI